MIKLTRILFLLILALVSCAATAQRVNSTASRLKVARTKTSGITVFPADTVPADTGMVRFSGYDKALRATRETVFVSNLTSGREISQVVFRIIYFDAQGRQLHAARKNLHVNVPSGETRRLDFPSWDKQFSFYYARSPRPRVAAIPYTVKIIPDTLILLR